KQLTPGMSVVYSIAEGERITRTNNPCLCFRDDRAYVVIVSKSLGICSKIDARPIQVGYVCIRFIQPAEVRVVFCMSALSKGPGCHYVSDQEDVTCRALNDNE